MKDDIPDALPDLVNELLPWARTMRTCLFYIYGSRVRGDHRTTSDIDICFDAESANAADAIGLQLQEIDGVFEDLPAKYRCLVRDQSKRWPELRDRIRSAPVVFQKENIICVVLPPASKTSTPSG